MYKTFFSEFYSVGKFETIRDYEVFFSENHSGIVNFSVKRELSIIINKNAQHFFKCLSTQFYKEIISLHVTKNGTAKVFFNVDTLSFFYE